MTFLIALAAVLAEPVPDGDALASFLAEFTEQRAGIRAVKAHFTQTTVSPDETMHSEGTVIYARPKRLIFRYDDPDLVFVLDDLRSYEYDAELKQLQIIDLDEQPHSEAFYLGFEGNPARLLEAYHVSFLRPGDDESTAGIIALKPKDAENAYFLRATLRFRRGDYLPQEIHIENDESSNVVIEISDYKVNDEFDASELQIYVPEGTTVIDNEQFVEIVGASGKYFPAAAVPWREVESEAIAPTLSESAATP